MEIFIELVAIIALATFFSFIMRLLRQPLIIGYILSGIVIGPYFLNILKSTENIELFSKIGITILLFIVGLNLNPKVVKEVGKVSLVTGVGQVLFTSVVGFFIALFLGIDKIAALYVAIALTFSSTIIILKLLSDKRDLNKLYGRIAIGFLLVQDVIATIILIFLSALTGTGNANIIATISLVLAKGIGMGVFLYLVSGYILPRFSKFIASSQELLYLFSITWGLGLAGLFYLIGLSIEIGALVAGVSLSVTPFAYEIGSRLKPLRDFFIVLFFVLLGSQMVLDSIPQIVLPAVVLSLFVLIGNPIIVVLLMHALGHKRRTSFLSGLAVAQISEFSLILAAVGFNVGHLSREILSLVTLVGLITIAGSTYLILYSEKIYPKVEKILKVLEFRKSKNQSCETESVSDLLLFGYHRGGEDFINAFNKLDKEYLIIDFNPQAIEKLKSRNLPYRYGDAEDGEFLQELCLSSAKLVVSTIPDHRTNVLLLKRIRQVNQKAIVIIFSHEVRQAKELYENGATYVVMSRYIGTRYVANMIQRIELDKKEFEEERQKHIQHIEKRLEETN